MLLQSSLKEIQIKIDKKKYQIGFNKKKKKKARPPLNLSVQNLSLQLA